MFTGLIEEVGIIRSFQRRGDGGHLSIQARTVLAGTRVGDSIAVSGACLTVVELRGDGFVVDCMPETLSHTTLGQSKTGTPVNLERALALGSRLGGHLVLGHVDAVAEILAVTQKGIAWELKLSLPEVIRGCIAPKGSIAIDGISLTVAAVDAEDFAVGIIPHTLRETTLRSVKTGVRVNLEADVLARYVLRTVQTLGEGIAGRKSSDAQGGFQAQSSSSPAEPGLTEEWLRQQGFV